MFLVALCLAAQEGVEPQLYADNLKCVSRDLAVLLRAARLTTGFVRLVGQEPARSKCSLMVASRVVREDMRDWTLTDEGDWWTVKLDLRTFRGWSSTLASRVRLVISRVVLVFVLPLGFHGRLRLFDPLHGIEASSLAVSNLRKRLLSSIFQVVWSRRRPLENVGAVSLLDGSEGCDPAYCVVWFLLVPCSPSF